MKRVIILSLLVFIVFGILLMQMSLVVAHHDSDKNDDKNSFWDWLKGLFKPTGNSITGLSSESGSDGDKEGDSGSSENGDNGDDSNGDSSTSGSSDDSNNGDDNGDSDNGDEKSDSDDNGDPESKETTKTETKETITDEQGREVTIETETKMKNGIVVESEEKRTFIDEFGNKVVIKTETETNGEGEIETKVTKSYIASDGSIVKETTKKEIGDDGEIETKYKIETIYLNGDIIIQEQKTKVEDGESKIISSITFKGAEFTTKLKVTAKIEEKDGNFEEKFSVKLSTGAEQPIVSPDQAALAALEVLGTTNGFSIEVVETVGEDGITTAVFEAKAETAGNLFGLPFFKVDIPLETLLDAEGNVIDFKEPWYAPFVTGLDNAEICHTEGPTREVTNSVLITEIKALLEEGNNAIGACVAVCKDNILTDNELCDSNSQSCTTAEGYTGTETCNALCDGFDACATTESCGDGFVNGPEVCDGGTQACTTTEGYAGTETCNATCNGVDECTTSESCGDGFVNGLEACDDGNAIDGDGCDSLCQIEQTPALVASTTPPTEEATI